MRTFRLLSRTLGPALCLVAGLTFAAPVKIGLVETLSGPQASSGLAFRTGVRYAVDRMNAEGGWNGESIQLLEYDNQGVRRGLRTNSRPRSPMESR